MIDARDKAQFTAGPLLFTAKHEAWDGNIEDHTDQGVSIEISSKLGGQDTVLLRFNCFDFEKSYIYGPENVSLDHSVSEAYAGPNTIAGGKKIPSAKLYRMDPTVDGNPIGWTIRTLETMLPNMLKRAGYPNIAAEVNYEDVALILPDLQFAATQIYISGRNTVKHYRGSDLFDAGNIRFGLEMRKQGDGNGGLAIHVLTDLGGEPGKSYTEETEVLAFDCFIDGPHYHYGPRNKNHQIYWDETVVPDPLGWVLDQFRNRMLGPMIIRAGYPGVAADLDQRTLDTILPRIEKRARQMQAMGLPVEPTPAGVIT